VAASLDKAMHGEGHFHLEYRFKRKDGAYTFIEDRGVFLKDENGKTQRMLGTMKNISVAKKAMDDLRESKEELEIKTTNLEEVNTALKVLLRQREEDRKDLEERFASNVKKLVLPYLEKMKKGRLDAQQSSCLNIMETNLNEIVSPFLHSIRQLNLTPRETQIASLIKDGMTSKEIGQILGVAPSAVNTYRNKIRYKLNLTRKKVNLQLYLESIK
jgi:DNA-binding CsgD family transcriptional regulator